MEQEGLEVSPGSKTKRVSFGPVTVIPIPRRGKFSLSLSSPGEETEVETPVLDTPIAAEEPSMSSLQGLSFEQAHAQPPSAAPNAVSPLSLTLDSQETPLEMASPLECPSQADGPLGEVAKPASVLTESQVEYLQRSCEGSDHPLEMVLTQSTDRASNEREEGGREEPILPVPATRFQKAPYNPEKRPRVDLINESPSFGFDSFSASGSTVSPRESSTQRFVTALGDFLGVSPSTEETPLAAEVRCDCSSVGGAKESPSPNISDSEGASASASAARSGRAQTPEAIHLTEEPVKVARRLDIDREETPAELDHSGEPLVSQAQGEHRTIFRCVFCHGESTVDAKPADRSTAGIPEGGPQGSCSSLAENTRAAGGSPHETHRPSAGHAEEIPPALPAGFMAQEGYFFHAACALWCPEVYFDSGTHRLMHLADALARSADIKCGVCRRKAAAIGCASADCQLSFHLPCAIAYQKAHPKEGRMRLDAQHFTLWCPQHK